MAETYRHEVVKRFAQHLNVDKLALEEFVIEWEAAEPAPICEGCGDPVVDGEPYAVDEETGETLGHAECIPATEDAEPYDRREDPDYWREDD